MPTVRRPTARGRNGEPARGRRPLPIDTGSPPPRARSGRRGSPLEGGRGTGGARPGDPRPAGLARGGSPAVARCSGRRPPGPGTRAQAGIVGDWTASREGNVRSRTRGERRYAALALFVKVGWYSEDRRCRPLKWSRPQARPRARGGRTCRQRWPPGTLGRGRPPGPRAAWLPRARAGPRPRPRPGCRPPGRGPELVAERAPRRPMRLLRHSRDTEAQTHGGGEQAAGLQRVGSPASRSSPASSRYWPPIMRSVASTGSRAIAGSS